MNDPAIRAFTQAVNAAPDNASCTHHLGLACAQAGQRELARQTLEKALKLTPDFDGADNARAVLGTVKG